MYQLGIAAVGYDRGPQKCFRFSLRDSRQKMMKPAAKFCASHDASHQISFHQRRRKKVFPARLPRAGIIDVTTKIGAGTFDDQSFQLLIPNPARVIKRERQTKGRIGMYAGPNGVSLLGKKVEILLSECIGQWL